MGRIGWQCGRHHSCSWHGWGTTGESLCSCLLLLAVTACALPVGLQAGTCTARCSCDLQTQASGLLGGIDAGGALLWMWRRL